MLGEPFNNPDLALRLVLIVEQKRAEFTAIVGFRKD